jgi:PAS domain-containing protein
MRESSTRTRPSPHCPDTQGKSEDAAAGRFDLSGESPRSIRFSIVCCSAAPAYSRRKTGKRTGLTRCGDLGGHPQHGAAHRRCFMRDITDRKNAEKSIQQSQNHMNFILEHNRSAIAIHDKNGALCMSAAPIRFFRVSEPKHPRPPSLRRIPESGAAAQGCAHSRVLQGKYSARREASMSTTTGRRLDALGVPAMV